MLSKKKVLEFSNLKGISKKKVVSLCINKGCNPNNQLLKLKNFYYIHASKIIVNEFNLARVKKKIKFFWQIKLYRGIKHMLGLPVHGQRTKTNSKTKRKFNFFK